MAAVASSTLDAEVAAVTSAGRKLASIQVIRDIIPHPNADRLVVAHILDWEAIINVSEEVKIGDVVVYIETDALLPLDTKCIREDIKTRFKKNKFKKEWWYRVKIIGLRGRDSMGLVVPLHILDIPSDECVVGNNVTSLLGIRKWNPKVWSPGVHIPKPNIMGAFPSHIVKKTDEMRIQTVPHWLRYIPSLDVYEISEKEDGTSVSYYYDPVLDRLVVCSRNYALDEPLLEDIPLDDVDDKKVCPIRDYTEWFPNEGTKRRKVCFWWYVAKKYHLEERLRTFYQTVCLQEVYNDDPLMTPDRKTVRSGHRNIFLQGEIVGPNIQKNLLGLSDVELRIFNVGYQRDDTMPQKTLLQRCGASYVDGFLNARFPKYITLRFVPLLETGGCSLWNYHTVGDHLIPLTRGLYPGTKNHREGIVVRVGDATGEVKLSFKVINPDYLHKHD